jgi:hypothetical protein
MALCRASCELLAVLRCFGVFHMAIFRSLIAGRYAQDVVGVASVETPQRLTPGIAHAASAGAKKEQEKIINFFQIAMGGLMGLVLLIYGGDAPSGRS